MHNLLLLLEARQSIATAISIGRRQLTAAIIAQVSLYQVLPRANSGQRQHKEKEKEKQEEEEQALRLLDIRRIDLDSSGWESFYAKRAVSDWLRDASSNLGE